MRSKVTGALFALLLVCSSASETETPSSGSEGQHVETKSSSHVLTLDASNFDEVVAKHPFVVVEFYAPWCGHCQQLEPEYEKAASALSGSDPPIVLAKVDANDEINKELASKHEISGFPTLKIFKNKGEMIQEYKGPREADGIVKYLKKQVGPASTVIRSTEDADTIIDTSKIFIVGVFPEFSGKEFDNFITVAEKLRSEYDFGHTLEAKFLPRGDSEVKVPTVRLLKPFDELFRDFKDFDVDALEKFILEASTPIVVFFDKDPNNHPFVVQFFNSEDPKAMLFVNFSAGNFEEFKLKYIDVAKSYKGKKISFLIGDLAVSDGAFQYFGLSKEQVPLIIIQTINNQKYLKANVESLEIAAWVKDYMAGNVEPYKRSEPIPEANSEPVKVVVGDSIHDVVFNSGKNVLLEFYAPWCGHCQQLAPILEEVAVSFENDPDVIIAKLDATVNDFPAEFVVQGFPTMYFRSSSGELVSYVGDRTKEAIIEFIQKHKDGSDSYTAIKSEPESIFAEESAKDEL